LSAKNEELATQLKGEKSKSESGKVCAYVRMYVRMYVLVCERVSVCV
jgi:hypothetical protein